MKYEQVLLRADTMGTNLSPHQSDLCAVAPLAFSACEALGNVLAGCAVILLMLWVAFLWPFVIYWNSPACFLLREAWNEGESGSTADFGIRRLTSGCLAPSILSESGGHWRPCSYSEVLRGLLGEFFPPSLKQIHVRLAFYLKHFTTSKSIAR